MKVTRTTIISIIVSLITVAVFVCWGTGMNCSSLFSLKNCIGDAMRNINPYFNKTFDSKRQTTPRSEESCSEEPCSEKKIQVFIDWRRLYWGNLGDLTKPERYFTPRDPVQTTRTGNFSTAKNEALQQFTQEIRAALKAFEKRYCIKINWRKKDLTLPDVTTQFINFWDKGYRHVKESEFKEQTNTEGRNK